MATEAFVLINTQLGKEDEILAKVREIPEIVEAFIVMGSYDLVAKISIEDAKKLKPLVTNHIRSLPGIKETVTIIVV
jgi:DNA-binding Lrp family transcriptional regulator